MKTSKSATMADLAQQFISNPSAVVESRIMRALNAQLKKDGFAPLRDMFIEWGCVEHGVIHVFYDDGQGILEINPKSGVATAH